MKLFRFRKDNLARCFLKSIRVMKLCVAFSFLLVFQLYAGTLHSQTTNLSLSLKNKTVEQAIDLIEKESDYSFLFTDGTVDIDRIISLNVANKSINDILSILFKNTDIDYKVVDKQIILSHKAVAKLVQQKDRVITGRITDNNGEPIIGANVSIVGMSLGTITDVDGNFSLEVPENATLQISYIGYLSQRVSLKDQKHIHVELIEDTQDLEEIVVIGYGTQRKGDVTSAISSIKSDNFIKGAVSDAGQLIQGKVAGLTITRPSGDPTGNSQIMLRGITTLMSSTEPLILIDGVPGDLNTVAPEDIESIDVLKDGSAAAIYGSRGSNGVIIISTKNLKGEMPPSIDYSGYLSTSSIYKKPDFLTASETRQLIAGGETSLVDYGYDTDWLGEITRTPISHVHNISLKGGGKNTNYIFSANYRSLQGVIKKSDKSGLTLRGDITHRMYNNKLVITAGIINSSFKKSDLDHYIYRQAVIRNPTDRIYDDNADYVERPLFDYFNPVALLNEYDLLDETRNMRWHSTIKVTPVKDWNIKLLISSEKSNNDYGYSTTYKHYETTENGKNSTAKRSSWSKYTDYLDLTTDYKFSIKDHNFTVLAGYNYEKGGYDDMEMSNYDFPSDLYSFNSMNQGNALLKGLATMNSSQKEYKRAAFLARLTYNFADKYLLMASVRQEGSSKFGANHKWGTFPAASVGWRINRESFLSDVAWVDNLMFRAGVGVTGTEPTDSYMSLIKMNYNGHIFSNGEWIKQVIPSSNSNPDLKWEKKTEYNLGLDYSLFNGRIGGAVDYYIRRTKDMLWNYSVPVPPYLYDKMTANVGEMENKGLEVLINTIPVKSKNFEWNSSINFSTNKNKLISLNNDKFQTNTYFDKGTTGTPLQQQTHRIDVGGPIGNFFGYKSVDITDNGTWILENSKGERIPFEDRTADDKTYLGNGLPKWYAGWNNTFRYKNLDLNITMRGAFGYQILNMQRMYYENNTITYNRLSSAFDKVYGKAVLKSEHEYVSYYIENGDFWKIDNITIGYTVPIKNDKFIKNARVWASGSNMLTITGYKGLDPEVSASTTDLDPGVDNRDKYPTTRTFTFGVNLTF